jgi:hypothetical protein
VGDENLSLALVYLARGADGGLAAARAFFEAYRVYPARCPHELIVIAKGWSGIEGLGELRQLVQEHSARLVDLPDDGFDWGAYLRVAPKLSHDWLCFLNTHSRPRVDGWLNFLKMAADACGSSFGAVGATASWQTLAPILPPPSLKEKHYEPLFYFLRVILNAVRFAPNILDFASFPNPHLRTNAFLVRRELFVSFMRTQKIPRCKRDAGKIESGRSGLGNYLASRGLKAVVAGADGKVYEPKLWMRSGTFRVPGQPNLLVADNQTTIYHSANPHMKRNLERAAWGRVLTGETLCKNA